MAGKTLSGIGDEETGKLELPADDTPEPSVEAASPAPVIPPPASPALDRSPDKVTPPARATDRMPLSFGAGSSGLGGSNKKSNERVPFATIIGAPVPVLPPEPVSVDEDKVAEGLKKLRSLDEPLGAIPSSMPTLKELPALEPPTRVTPEGAAAAVAAELQRSRGTAHGHAISPDLLIAESPRVSVDDRLKGTLLGHSLHLPDLPSPAEPSRPAEVRDVARVPPLNKTLLVPGPEEKATQPKALPQQNDLSQNDARFFDTTPINDELAPENPRSKLVARGAIFLAVTSIFVVAAIAWVRSGKSDSPETRAVPPVEPSPLDNNGANAQGATAPAPPPVNAVPSPPPPEPAAVPAPPPAPAAEAPAKVDDAKPAAAAHAKVQSRHAAPSATKPEATPRAGAHETPKTETKTESKPAGPGKRGKADEDPDGTLPLTE